MRAVLLTLILVWNLPASGGESVNPYTGVKWQDAQWAVTGADVVLVGEVTEAGKAEGQGWNGARRQRRDQRDWTAEIDIKQNVAVRVAEVLRGKCAAAELRLRLEKTAISYTDASRMLRSRPAKNPMQRTLPPEVFALRKGKSYLLFLERQTADTEKEEAGEKPRWRHLELYSPVEPVDSEAAESARDFCSQLSAWENPPKLSAEEDARVSTLIEQLGHADYYKRKQAYDALAAVAAKIAPLLIEAARGRDLERATAAERLIAGSRPKPGAVKNPNPPRPKEKPSGKPKLDLKLKNADDRAEIRFEEGRAVLRVKSSKGIGGLEVTLAEGSWPKRMVVELELKTLESFSVTNGKVTRTGALGGPGLAINEKEGFIEVLLPPELWAGEVRRLTIGWIDAYR